MAKIKQNPTGDTPQDTTYVPVNEETVPVPKGQLQSLLSRLDALEKTQSTPKKRNPKEKYTGPLTMKYAYYAKNVKDEVVLVPILSLTTFSPEPNLDSVYKNDYGQYTENQMIKLTLADGEVQKVSIKEIKHLKPSTPQTPVFVEDEFQNKIKGDTPAARDVAMLNRIKIYTFNDPTYGEIRVSSNCINIA